MPIRSFLRITAKNMCLAARAQPALSVIERIRMAHSDKVTGNARVVHELCDRKRIRHAKAAQRKTACLDRIPHGDRQNERGPDP